MTTWIASAPIALGNSQYSFTAAYGINDQDEIVGIGNGATVGLAWQNGQITVLPAVAGDQNISALVVNAQGQVVGYSYTGQVYHAISWQNGVATQLPGLGASSRDYGINDQGVIVGSSEDSNQKAVATEIVNGSVIQLGVLPGGYSTTTNLAESRAFAVNDAGQVVGISLTASGVEHAVLWQNGAITDLGSIAGGGASNAVGINKSGVIIGNAIDGNQVDQALVWQNGSMTVLPDLQSNGNSFANGINAAGLIVGQSDLYTSSGWVEHAVLWQNGALVDLNSLLTANSGWVLNSAGAINDNDEIVGVGTFNGVQTGFMISLGESTQPMISAAAALQSFQATPHSAAMSVFDSAANIQANFDGLEGLAAVGKLLRLQFSDAGTPTLTLSAQQWSADSGVVGAISGSYGLHLTEATVSEAQSVTQASAVGIADSVNAVQGDLDQLQGWAASGKLLGISLTGGGQDPTLFVTAQQAENDQQALKAIQGNFNLFVDGATVAQALSLSTEFSVSSVAITDSIDNVANAAGQLSSMHADPAFTLSGSEADLAAHFDTLLDFASGSLSIAVTDTNFPILPISLAEYAKMDGLLHTLSGDMILSVDASQQANVAIAGADQVATMAVFPDAAADYSLSLSGGSLTVSDVSTGRTSTDTLSNLMAVEFKDQTVFFVTAPSGSSITSGNVAELYSAVLARTPDVPGLAFYEHALSANPNLSLLQLAEFFLQSAEYQNNPAHAYAQSAAGDGQFITDTYQNLLHRAPDTGAVAFYQTVVAQFTSGLTPGTAAYQAAELQGHAQVLVYFSASQEFLSDVQITTQHPVDAQHWLLVV